MLKEFLSQKGVVFKEHDVSRDRAAAQDLVRTTGQMSVPVTVINGETIVGFDRVRLEQTLSRLQRPSFGASIADAGKITARQGSATTLGAYVGSVRSGSVAERLGLMQGDIITEVNMQPIANSNDLESALSKLRRERHISLVFLRGNNTLKTEGTL
jgi:S1-C subfamily serine protease